MLGAFGAAALLALAGCVSFSSHTYESASTTQVSDNRPDCVRSLQRHLRDVRHAQPIVGLFVGVSNYGEPSRLWSTPAHTIGAVSFRAPFYLTATTDVQKADLRLLSSLVVAGNADLETSTRRVLGDAAGMVGELTSADGKDGQRSNLLRRAQPTTRSHLIAQLDDALLRADAVATTQGQVLFVFYMSAHGWIGADGRTYLLPSDADYDQPFHCDFVNHTLTAPSEDAHLNSVTILCYFSDVNEDCGPMHYVTRPDSLKVAGPEATFDQDPKHQAKLQKGLQKYERSSASPAGSVVPYSTDIYHRGTNLTASRGARYALMTCFKAASDDSIGFHAWAFHHTKPWRNIFDSATPEQLACFGVQKPGDPFWTVETLRRAQTRYPNWDMTPYREAMVTA